MISSPSFKIVTNLKINLDDEKDKPDVKPKGEEIEKTKPDIKSNKEQKQDIKIIRTKPDTESNKERKLDTKMMETEPDTHEEEKASLILEITVVFTVWWMFK